MRLAESRILEYESGPITPLMESVWGALLGAFRQGYLHQQEAGEAYFREAIRRRWRVRQLKRGADMLVQPAAANLATFLAAYRPASPPLPYELSVQGVHVHGQLVLARDSSGSLWIPQPFWVLPEAAACEPGFVDLCRWIYARSALLDGRRSCGIVWLSVSDGLRRHFSNIAERDVRRFLEGRIVELREVMKTPKKQSMEAGGDRMVVLDRRTGRPRYALEGDAIRELEDMDGEQKEEENKGKE